MLVHISARPIKIINDEWNLMDGNIIAYLHLVLADEVLSNAIEKKTDKEIYDTLTNCTRPSRCTTRSS